MVPKGIIIILFGTYVMTIAAIISLFLMSRKWVAAAPESSKRLIRAIWIIGITVTIVFGGLATGVITLLTLRQVGFF